MGRWGYNFRTRRLSAAWRRAAAIPVAVLFVGCALVGPDYTPPELALPDVWNNPTDAKVQAAPANLARWWRILDDPMLTGLIEQAVAGNLDRAEALSRVREARIQAHSSRAALFPTLDASGSLKRSGGSSRETAETAAAGFDAGWELDLFGGTRRAIEASQADLGASVASLNDVTVTLLAEVAVNYIDFRTTRQRIAAAEQNVALMEETWALVKALAQAGNGDQLAVDQARYNLESARAKIPPLIVSREAALNGLAVLTGKPPGALSAALSASRPLPTVGSAIVVGVPADVIRRRPDIRQAERELAASTARVGVAEAARYPSFTLSGSVGVEALSLGDLFTAPERVWSLGPTLKLPLFDAGARRDAVAAQNELRTQALLNYRRTILDALEEVENAMAEYAGEQRKREHLDAAVTAARSAAELAENQYLTGMTGFSDVLDAQRSLLSFEDQLTESRGAVLTGLVRLYKALGGGWQPFDGSIDNNASGSENG